MKFDLYPRVALAEDLPERRLRRGDVLTVVDHHAGGPGQESGYSLEVFNAVGETVDVVTLRESQLEPLNADELFSVRSAFGVDSPSSLNTRNRVFSPNP